MKLIIPQEKLKEGISIVERVSIKSITLPVLNNILIKTEKNFLSFSTTNLEIGIKWWNLAKIEKEGEILVPTRIFSNFINSLPPKPVTLEVKDLVLNLECDNYKTQIKGLSSEDFPIIPKVGENDTFSVGSIPFTQNLNQVVDIVSPSISRPEISGVYFLFQKDQIRMVATDSFRLGEKKMSLKSPTSKEYSFILPQGTAKEIINIFSEKTEEKELKIYFSPNQILFESRLPETPHPRIQITSRLIEGEFPNYQDIIPKKFGTRAVFQKNTILNQIKTASLFSGKGNEIKLNILPKENKIEIFSQSSDLGEYYSFLPGEIKGEKVSASFNHRFLTEGLFNIQNQKAVLEFTNEEGPAVLSSIDEQGYLYVIMPIKTA